MFWGKSSGRMILDGSVGGCCRWMLKVDVIGGCKNVFDDWSGLIMQGSSG